MEQGKKQLFWGGDIQLLDWMSPIGQSYVDIDFIYKDSSVNIGLEVCMFQTSEDGVLFGTNKNNSPDINSGRGHMFMLTGYHNENIGLYTLVVPGTGDMFCWSNWPNPDMTIVATSKDAISIHELRYENLTQFLPAVYIDGERKSFSGGTGTTQDSYFADFPLSIFCNRWHSPENRNAFGNCWYLRRIWFYKQQVIKDYRAALKSGKAGLLEVTTGSFFEGTGEFEVSK